MARPRPCGHELAWAPAQRVKGGYRKGVAVKGACLAHGDPPRKSQRIVVSDGGIKTLFRAGAGRSSTVLLCAGAPQTKRDAGEDPTLDF